MLLEQYQVISSRVEATTKRAMAQVPKSVIMVAQRDNLLSHALLDLGGRYLIIAAGVILDIERQSNDGQRECMT
jgi:hypothetical protein